jgi:hypothetical protein
MLGTMVIDRRSDAWAGLGAVVFGGFCLAGVRGVVWGWRIVAVLNAVMGGS